ncbi:hypothetical protein Hamer_G017770 [Homarus americanus]|uniref:Uncharacterized protein n=1 Tax=Homarus americanus TaxID=6706 RepID=A0A8J5N6E5_HOMAM|nr:hypothetical protein Hamer_G017770 [Homarus americanus]
MVLLAGLVALMAITCAQAQTVTYSFTQFPYKESVGNEKVWSEYEVACAQSPRCLELRGVHHTRCVRQCVSPSCYLDIYTHDEVSWRREKLMCVWHPSKVASFNECLDNDAPEATLTPSSPTPGPHQQRCPSAQTHWHRCGPGCSSGTWRRWRSWSTPGQEYL